MDEKEKITSDHSQSLPQGLAEDKTEEKELEKTIRVERPLAQPFPAPTAQTGSPLVNPSDGLAGSTGASPSGKVTNSPGGNTAGNTAGNTSVNTSGNASGNTANSTGGNTGRGTDGTTHPQWRHMLADLGPGTVLVGQYSIVERLGSGGMGDVYRCEDLVLHRHVAVKLLGLDSRRDPQIFVRFQTEARAIARLEHRNIVQIYNMCMDEYGQPVMVMELVQGQSLAQLIKDGGPIPLDAAIDYTVQICSALSCAHQRGVIHRDLKPGNVMVVGAGTAEAQIKLLDFGIAKLEYESLSATRSGEIFGSPSYMSPEQAKGEPVDARTDQYSLACMLFEMLTGRVPFIGKSAMDVLMGHIDRQPPPASAVCNSRFPEALEGIIATMLAKEPPDRFATISDVSAALVDVANDLRSGQTQMRPGALKAVPAPGATGQAGKASAQTPDSLPLAQAGTIKPLGPSAPGLTKQMPIVATVVLILALAGLVFWKSLSMQQGLHSTDEESQATGHGEKRPSIHPITDEQLKKLIDRSRESKILDLDERQLTDKQFSYLQDCAHLTNLNLYGCRGVTEAGLNSLVQIPLTALSLASTDIRNEDLKPVARMSQLEFLSLNGTAIDDTGCRILLPLRNLNRILLNKTAVTSETLRTLSNFKYLEDISLASDRVLDDLSLIQMLHPARLNLDTVGLKDNNMAVLAKIQSMDALMLDNNEITDRGLLMLAQIPQLRVLSLRKSKISLEGIKSFALKTNDMCDVISDRKCQIHAGEAVPQGPNLLQNPGFEDLMNHEMRLINRKSGDQLPHWNVFDGSVEVVRTKWKAHDGDQSLALNAVGGGIVRQVVDTVPDSVYQLDIWVLADTRHPKASKLALNAAGQQHTITVEPSDSGDPEHGWKRVQWKFKALSRKTAVQISSLTAAPGGPVIDSVSLRVLPPKGQ